MHYILKLIVILGLIFQISAEGDDLVTATGSVRTVHFSAETKDNEKHQQNMQLTTQRLSAKGIQLTIDIIDALSSCNRALTEEDYDNIQALSQNSPDSVVALIHMSSNTLQKLKDALSSMSRQIKITSQGWHTINTTLADDPDLIIEFLGIHPIAFQKITHVLASQKKRLTNKEWVNIKKFGQGNEDIILALTAMPYQAFDILTGILEEREAALTKADWINIIDFSGGNFDLIITLAKISPDVFQRFVYAFQQEAKAILRITHCFVDDTQLTHADKAKLSRLMIDTNSLSIYQQLDCARIIIKRKSFWAYVCTYVDPDGFISFLARTL